MSYILNALKKAERDRMREETQDLDDFVSSGWDPYQAEPDSRGNYKLTVIIALSAVLLFYAFYSLTDRNQTDNIADKVVTEELSEKNSDTVVLDADVIVDKVIEKKPSPEPQVSDKKPEIKQLQLPQVTIAGHIYIRNDSPKNRIFVGEKTYYVGDRIDNEWIIESINFDSLSIRSGTLRSELPLR